MWYSSTVRQLPSLGWTPCAVLSCRNDNGCSIWSENLGPSPVQLPQELKEAVLQFLASKFVSGSELNYYLEESVP